MPVANVIEAKPISDRKRAANQANAQKSTGPRTIEGKTKISLNAVTHGLRSEMVILPKEDPALFEAMRLGFFKDWNPQTETRRVLVERIAADAWRMRRCVKIEHDRISDRVETALANHEAAIQARMQEGFRLFTVQPTRAIEFFKGESTGVRLLIKAWTALGVALTDFRGWNDPHQHHIRLLNLLGHRGDADAVDAGDAALASWLLLVWNRPDLGEGNPPIDDDAEAAVFARDLSAMIAREIADLEASLADYPDPEFVRQRIAGLASFDPSSEGRALQRYEGQLNREFRSNLNQIMKLAQTGSDLIEEMEASAEAPNKPTEAPPAEAPNKPTEAPAEAPIKATKPTDAPIKATEIPFESPNKPTDQTSIVCPTPVYSSSEPTPVPLIMQIC